MLTNKTYFIDSCDDVELNIKRESKLEFRLTYDDEKEIEAVVCVISGIGNDINDDLYISDFIARNYKIAAVNVNYHCIGNRPQTGSTFYLDDIDKLILKTSLETINLNIPYDVYAINSYNEMNDIMKYINYEIEKMKSHWKIEQNYRLDLSVSLQPTKNEYQNFGIMQATDILNALLYINKNPPFKITGVGMKNILIGASHGGYLANLCAKIAPWNIDCIIDNSSQSTLNELWRLIGFGKEIDYTTYHCAGTTQIFKNISLAVNDKTHWTSNKQSPRYFSPARKLIREIFNKEHLKTQSLYPKPKYISYHSNFDQFVPLQDKEQMYNYLKELGFDIEFTKIMDQNDVDGKFIKNLEHGMGIPMKLLIKKHLPDILKEKVKDKTCKKEISYKSDDLIYTFKEKDDKILLEVNEI
ncbi:DUF2920 family protein [Campylobacter insulaenigrae]|uniref:DUF2920 family protein n=1 Tax=Campylobacter insulaenigrae TaxID=260714 RepID=UPI002152869C|nr:DUF2920 family protein [Campylobacter insulaenigrae]MCR6576096.1 DUF2920 family protein [Campylobacter insulaenigrae]